MAGFDNTRLPVDIEKGARGGPKFRTDIVALANGRETRNQTWARNRNEYDISYGIQKTAQLEAVLAFFYARRGRLRGFRFKDWTDYKIANEPLGTGNGVTTAFQMTRTYADAIDTYVRKITRPVSGTIEVRKDGVLQVGNWSESMGLITFTAAPANATVLTISAQFDVPCRFDDDRLDITAENEFSGVVNSITIVEIKE